MMLHIFSVILLDDPLAFDRPGEVLLLFWCVVCRNSNGHSSSSLSSRLDFPCEGLDSEINHLLPAFSAEQAECGLQHDPLLFSCAGSSVKYRRLCPCRDYRNGQVALCRDCL